MAFPGPCQQGLTIPATVDTTGLAKLAGTSGQLPVSTALRLQTTPDRHNFPAADGLERSDQDRTGGALILGHEVQAVMYSVDQVHIGQAGWPVHDGCPGSLTPGGMRSRVVPPQIGLDLDDAAGDRWLACSPHVQNHTDELRGDLEGGAGEEIPVHGDFIPAGRRTGHGYFSISLLRSNQIPITAETAMTSNRTAIDSHGGTGSR